MPKDYNPDEPFEGLGILGWFKVVFRTRAQTLRQNDVVTKMLFDKCNEARAEADQASEAVQRLSSLVVLQHRALEMSLPVLNHLFEKNYSDPQMDLAQLRGAMDESRYAIEAAKEKL